MERLKILDDETFKYSILFSNLCLIKLKKSKENGI